MIPLRDSRCFVSPKSARYACGKPPGLRRALEEDVRGLHVPVQQTAGVRGVERAADLPHHRERPRHRERAFALEELLEVALDVAHGDVEDAVLVARVVDRDDVRVVERRGGPRLAHEPLAEALVVCELLGQELQRDLVPEAGVLGAIDDAHPAAAEQRLDPVPGELGADPRHNRHFKRL